MSVVATLRVPELKFDNYFLAFDGEGALHDSKPWYDREGILELCHNYGTENDANYTLNNGNSEPHRGFGHICFSVDDLEQVCDDLFKGGVKFQKKLIDGRQKNIAFALDPDGYWIELIGNQVPAADTGSGKPRIRFNHTMIRIKDPEKSLGFYKDVLGMELVRKLDFEGAKFSLYFLVFPKPGADISSTTVSNTEGVLELTQNWGTENDTDFKYHNGNTEPQGFGHIAVSVPDVDQAMEYLDSKGVTIKKRRTDGKMKFIGFVADPDGYMVEIIPKADFPEKILSE
jgi:lactoylglutathione lyase